MGTVEGADRHRPALEIAGRAHHIGQLLHLRYGAFGMGPQQSTGLGELEPPVRPGEQAHAQRRLQPADLIGQAGLGDVFGERRRGESPVPGGAEEVAQLLDCRFVRHALNLL